jgi:hypothetical protein
MHGQNERYLAANKGLLMRRGNGHVLSRWDCAGTTMSAPTGAEVEAATTMLPEWEVVSIRPAQVGRRRLLPKRVLLVISGPRRHGSCGRRTGSR